MAVYLLKPKCGNYIGKPDADGNRITYKAGSKVSSDEDLVNKWPGKFELLSVSDEGSVPVAPEIPVPVVKKDFVTDKDMEEPIIKTPKEGKHGIDVSDAFPTAAKVELKVFEKSKWFTVVDPDNDEVLNEKKLRKDKVEAFLADYLPDDDDEDEDEEDEDGEDDDDDEE